MPISIREIKTLAHHAKYIYYRCMRIGPFYFDTKEILLLAAVVSLVVISYLGIDLVYFEANELLTLGIIVLMLKGLLSSVHNEAFFLHSIIMVFLTLFFPLFQVLIIFFITFFLFRLIKII